MSRRIPIAPVGELSPGQRKLVFVDGRSVVVFFAPTSAAEIELYGRGEKVVSTSADYCSYKADADNSSITAERLCAAVVRQLELGG